jgi:hypothetical protein
LSRAKAGLVVCIGFVAALVTCLPAVAQSSRIDGGFVTLEARTTERFGFYWETRLDPSTPPLADTFSTGTANSDGVVHRVLFDRSRRMYVGYDVVVTRLSEANTFRVTFKELTMTPELSRQFLGSAPSDWTPLRTPGWGLPAPAEIRGGDVLELTLLRNDATSQRVVDYVTVQEPGPNPNAGFRLQGQIPEREFSFAPGAPRDFRAGDVELTIRAPRLSINGKLDESSTRHFNEVSGSVVWFYTSNRGRYILSLVPRPELGFRRAGEVRGTSLSFVVGKDTFSLSTGARIAPGQAAFNLYVRHDPDWRATYPNADFSAFIMGAADRAESLVRN